MGARPGRVAIVFEEKGPDGWKPPKLALIRLQRVREAWKRHAIVTLNGADALALADSLADWRGAFTDER